jgi:hypothetical protein
MGKGKLILFSQGPITAFSMHGRPRG